LVLAGVKYFVLTQLDCQKRHSHEKVEVQV
jgi:hypothetical protein